MPVTGCTGYLQNRKTEIDGRQYAPLTNQYHSPFRIGTGGHRMGHQSKLKQLLATDRDPNEVQDWIFSLTPLGIAFLFFHFFILRMDIPEKPEVMIVGMAAGILGLQTYWVVRGWRKNHISTILLGLISIAIVTGGALLGLKLVS
jgi:NADH:ubiquinone oxidoreductase subunit H